jgi:hypothetical protein
VILDEKHKKNPNICWGFVTLTELQSVQSFKINYTLIIANVPVNITITEIYEK